MMRTLRWFPLVAAVFLFCSQGGFARAAQEEQKTDPGQLVVNLDKSSLLRQTLYLEDLNAALAPVLTPQFLDWIGTHDADVAKKLHALLTVKTKEVAFLVSRKDFLATLELPEGNLERLAKGDTSPEVLSEAFGAQAAAEITAALPQLATSVQADVLPGIHRIGPNCLFTVVGKRLLLGSADMLVEVSRNKLLAGNHITAIPAGNRQFWGKTDLLAHCAPSAQGPFANKNISYEYTLNGTPQGFDYTFSNNLPDLLPALEGMRPLALDNLPLFGKQIPFYSFVFDPKIIGVISRLSFTGELSEASGIASPPPIPDEMMGFAGGIEHIGLFWGGSKAQALGYPMPGGMLAVKGTPDITTMLQGMLTDAAPIQWAEKKLDGWDAFFTADMLPVEGAPIPMPLFFGRRGGELVCGVMNHEQLDAPLDGKEVLALLPEGVKTGLFADMDAQGLWAAAGEALKPGSPLQHLFADARRIPSQDKAFKALEELLRTPLPVRRMTQWYNQNFSQAEGRIVVEPSGPGDFMPRLYELIDACIQMQTENPTPPAAQ